MKEAKKSSFQKVFSDLLRFKWESESLKELILGKIDQYIICKDEKITVETFAQYTHSQNLSVDPNTLIKYLSNGDNILAFPKNITM